MLTILKRLKKLATGHERKRWKKKKRRKKKKKGEVTDSYIDFFHYNNNQINGFITIDKKNLIVNDDYDIPNDVCNQLYKKISC